MQRFVDNLGLALALPDPPSLGLFQFFFTQSTGTRLSYKTKVSKWTR